MITQTTHVGSRGALELQRGILHAPGGRSLHIDSAPSVIGRDPGCHLVVDARGVSAMHAEVAATPYGVRIRDLGSANGTWLGEVAIAQAFMTGSTVIRVARSELRFERTPSTTVYFPDVDRLEWLYGASPPMRELFWHLDRVAASDLAVLVEGETGTGKELVAKTIHERSARRTRNFVVVDCASLAPNLAESTLFGHERGAFTGAIAARKSPFVEANGGTIFLDEIGELPSALQPKFLRALAERRVRPVGARDYEPFDARVVAATRRDLQADVNAGEFRADLYFRLAQLRVRVPALRDRIEDVPGLIREFLRDLNASDAYRRMSRSTLDHLLRYDWPGNVRQLRNGVVTALALDDPDGPLDVAAAVGLKTGRPRGVMIESSTAYHDAKLEALRRFERAYFEQLYELTDGNASEIARRTGLQRTHVRRYLRLHGLVHRRI